MARSPQISVYPGAELKQAIEELAEEAGRSESNLLIAWVKDRPEVKEKLAEAGARG